jgi:ankyrin repeat protein
MPTHSCTIGGVSYDDDVLPSPDELLVACDIVLTAYCSHEIPSLGLLDAWHRISPGAKAILGHTNPNAIGHWAFLQFRGSLRYGCHALTSHLIRGGLHHFARDDYDGAMPLHEAAANNHLNWTVALLAAGADPDAATQHGRTALHYAARSGSFRILAALLHGKAKSSVRCKDGWTPLHDVAAADRQCTKAVVTLAKNGAVMLATNHAGQTARQIALSLKHDEVAAALARLGG